MCVCVCVCVCFVALLTSLSSVSGAFAGTMRFQEATSLVERSRQGAAATSRAAGGVRVISVAVVAPVRRKARRCRQVGAPSGRTRCV